MLNQSELRGVAGGMEHVLEQAVLHTVTEDIQIEMETPDGSVQTITVPASSLPDSSLVPARAQGVRRRQGSGRGQGGQGGSPAKVRMTAVGGRQEAGEEGSVSLSFHCWLGSVTERINQTMHYQFDGHPEPLVFHAPQVIVLTPTPS